MRPRYPVFLFSVFVGAACTFHEPLRIATLSVIRAPFTVVSSCVKILLTLPRLPRLAAENAALQAELSRQSLELAQTREALRHLTAAQTLLAPADAPQGIVASIIGRSPNPGQEMVLLNRGRQHGLQRDGVLVDASGVAGRIVEIHRATSLAMLITDPNSRVSGVVERSRESGLLVGQGRGMCQLIWLEAEADVVEGDRVVTSGLGEVFPKGLWLGTVVSVSRDRQAGSTTATVRPAASLGRLEEVRCLVPSSS